MGMGSLGIAMAGLSPAHLYGLFAIPYVLAALAMLGIGARDP
jgi:hypothetical protein